MSEWYWKNLIDGDTDFVEFHNRVYGCSGVNPDKFPCTGPNFTSVSHHLLTCCKLCVCAGIRSLRRCSRQSSGIQMSGPTSSKRLEPNVSNSEKRRERYTVTEDPIRCSVCTECEASGTLLSVYTLDVCQLLYTLDVCQLLYTLDVVLTSKHHEGWCNFKNSYHWNWNSIDEGPKRDLVGDLTNSVRKAGLHMGLYHSLREWFNPAYIAVRYSTHHTSISL